MNRTGLESMSSDYRFGEPKAALSEAAQLCLNGRSRAFVPNLLLSYKECDSNHNKHLYLCALLEAAAEGLGRCSEAQGA